MRTLQEVEDAVTRFSPEDLAAFRRWFAEFDAEEWNRRLEQDVEVGRLDALADEALANLREGRCTDLIERQ